MEKKSYAEHKHSMEACNCEKKQIKIGDRLLIEPFDSFFGSVKYHFTVKEIGKDFFGKYYIGKYGVEFCGVMTTLEEKIRPLFTKIKIDNLPNILENHVCTCEESNQNKHMETQEKDENCNLCGHYGMGHTCTKITGDLEYQCHCLEDNKKSGKDIYSCYVCEPPREKLSRDERLKRWIRYGFYKAKGMVDDQKLLDELIKKFNDENPL